jgi:tetratricopeptide (TPR) repeat protein
MVDDLDKARLFKAVVLREGHFDTVGTQAAFAAAFRTYGVDVEQLPPDEAAARITASAVRESLITVLDEWATQASVQQRGEPVAARLRAVARAADHDPARQELRDLVAAGNVPALAAWAARPDALRQPPATILLGAKALNQAKEANAATRLLIAAAQRYPSDFWLHHDLAHILDDLDPPRLEEAAGYYRAALALRPDSPGAHLNFGRALRALGRHDESVAAFDRALALQPGYAEAHINRAETLHALGRLPEALADCDRALAVKPDWSAGLNARALILHGLRRTDEALAALDRALALEPGDPIALFNRGNVLSALRRYPEALTMYDQALAARPNHFAAHAQRGVLLARMNRPTEALAAFDRAAALKPDHAEVHYNRGNLLHEMGRLDEALAAYDRALALKPDHAEANCNRGMILNEFGRFAEGLAAFRRGHALGSRRPNWPHPSAEWVRDAEQYVVLDAVLPAVLAGTAAPVDASAALALATFCTDYKKQHATAARFYATAFADDPALADDLAAAHRFTAACAATRAGTGPWRQQALTWLRADLTLLTQRLTTSVDPARAARHTLENWLKEEALAPVREESALATLPADERAAWEAFWAEVRGKVK